MLVGTFNSKTGWAGKTVTHEDGVFMLEGHGPIFAADVMEYDRRGHLIWAYDGLKAWVGALVLAAPVPPLATATDARATVAVESLADAARVAPPASQAYPQDPPVSAPVLPTEQVVVPSHSTGDATPRSGRLKRWHFVVIGACVVALLAVVAAFVFLPARSTSHSWPAAFEGTWLSVDKDAQIVVSGSGDQAVLKRISNDPDVGIWTYTFSDGGKKLVFDHGDDTGTPRTFQRKEGAFGDFVGDYALPKGGQGSERIVVTYTKPSLKIVDYLSDLAFKDTFTLAADGKSLVDRFNDPFKIFPDFRTTYLRQE